MVEPLVIGNLVGTGETEFALEQSGCGLRKVDGEIALFDAVTGQKKLSELLQGGTGGIGWRKILNGITKNILEDYSHVIDYICIEDGGTLCQADGGHLILV